MKNETGTILSAQAHNWREGRRLRAWELSHQGWTQTAIAHALGVTQGAVSQWLQRAKVGGVQALRRRKAPGAPSRLTAAQRAQMPRLLQRGAEAFGFRGNVWTRGRVGAVLRREFGVSYHPAHVGRLLRRCGWSRQKPVRRARQRDEAAIRRWCAERWPALQKKPGPSSARWCLWINPDSTCCQPWYAPMRRSVRRRSCVTG